MRRSSLVSSQGDFGQRDEDATPLLTPFVSRDNSSDAVPAHPLRCSAFLSRMFATSESSSWENKDMQKVKALQPPDRFPAAR